MTASRARWCPPPATCPGDVHGRLTVVGEAPSLGRRGRHYLCRCECGGERVVRGDNLRHGLTRSCGECRPRPSRSGGA
jgi:hypothetical protein